jgi:hypothetical protein
MRWIQIAFFIAGACALLTSLGFRGTMTGEDLWKAGIAILLGDVVLIQLWPKRSLAPATKA